MSDNAPDIAGLAGPAIEVGSYWTCTLSYVNGDWRISRILDLNDEVYVDLTGSWDYEAEESQRALVPALTLLKDYRRNDHQYPPEPINLSCGEEGCVVQTSGLEAELEAAGWLTYGMGGARCPEHSGPTPASTPKGTL